MQIPDPTFDKNKFWAYITAFGALWGFVEITLGSFLMSLRLPFAGIVLASIGVAILVAQRQILPVRGATLATGLVAALCKSISPGGILIQPMVAIIAESMLAEIALSYLPWRYLAAPVAGMLAALWTVFQQVAYQYLIYGRGLIELYIAILRKAANWLGMSETAGWSVLVAFVAVMLGLGISGGMFGLKLGKDAKSMLGKGDSEVNRP